MYFKQFLRAGFYIFLLGVVVDCWLSETDNTCLRWFIIIFVSVDSFDEEDSKVSEPTCR